MASSWGLSWGTSWADSWGLVGAATAVTTAGPRRSGATQYRAKTLSRELREKERAARKAARKLRVKVVEALETEAWFANPEAAKAARAFVKTEIEETYLPQFMEDGAGEALGQHALHRLLILAAQFAEMEDDDDLLLMAA